MLQIASPSQTASLLIAGNVQIVGPPFKKDKGSLRKLFRKGQ